MNIIVTGSIAYDYLMSFPGQFTEHFLPEHMSRVSLSFLVDTMDKRRGGCAPNIAYTLALLGERPRLMADRRAGLRATTAAGSRRRASTPRSCKRDRREVHRVVLLQHRRREQSDRVVLHGRDGECRRAVVPHDRRSAGSPSSRRTIRGRCSSMRRSAARSAFPYIWDPGQQCARMSGDELRDGLVGATIVICNDYELELIRQKTGLDEDRYPRAYSRAGRHAGRARLFHPARRLAVRTSRRSLLIGSSIRPVSAMPSRRLPEGHGARRELRDLRPARERRGDLRARTPRRSEPCVYLGGVQSAL